MKNKTNTIHFGPVELDIIVPNSHMPSIELIENIYKHKEVKKVYADTPNEYKIKLSITSPSAMNRRGMERLKRRISNTIHLIKNK